MCIYFVNVLNIFIIILFFKYLENTSDIKLIYLISPNILPYLLISLNSLIGIPPLGGFYAKLLIIFNSLLTINIFVYIILFISIISTVISSNYYLYMIKYLYHNYIYR